MTIESSETDDNPLGMEPKREKSGSDTYRKYNYQYHWAFCRLIDEHEKGAEYAIFVEEHEDVTLANSLDADSTMFEFNQIKETSKKHTIHSLTKINKGKLNSILGKLALGACNKSFSEKIHRVNFVSTGGYSFNLHKEGFSLEVIKSGDLSEDELSEIGACLDGITGSESLASKLAFVIPTLPDKDFDLVVEGKISLLISKLSPGLKYDSNSIYECVIRDLHRKGENSFDYKDWSTALKRKAVTSDQFEEVLNKHINRKPDDSLTFGLLQILKDEYQLKSVSRRSVVEGFNRYYIKRISSRDSLINEISRSIISLIDSLSPEYESAPDLEAKIKEKMLPEHIEYFATDEEFTGAFLYELLA